MKVYILTRCEFDHSDRAYTDKIVGVYSTEELAEKNKPESQYYNRYSGVHYFVEEYEVI
jgi:hypothetical protein